MDVTFCDAAHADAASPNPTCLGHACLMARRFDTSCLDTNPPCRPAPTAHPRAAHYRPTSPAVPPRRTSTSLVRPSRTSDLAIATVHPTPILADEPSLQPINTTTALPTSATAPHDLPSHAPTPGHADTPTRPAPRQEPSHAASTDLFQSSRAKPSATCLPNPARAGMEAAMITGRGVEARSGVGALPLDRLCVGHRHNGGDAPAAAGDVRDRAVGRSVVDGWHTKRSRIRGSAWADLVDQFGPIGLTITLPH